MRTDLIPKAHIPCAEIRQLKEILRQRLFLVRLRTMLKNRPHALLEQLHVPAPPVSDLFGKRGPDCLYQVRLPGDGQSPAHYYALGWNVDNPGTPQEEWSHSGALSGSNATLLVRRVDGISYAVLFNALPTEFAAFFNELTPAVRAAINSVRTWPRKDLFAKYP